MRWVVVATALMLGGCASARVAGDRAEDKVPGALAQPLKDVNLVRDKIPPALLEAIDRPYVPPQPMTCRQIINLIQPLDEALGPDLDAPPSADNPSMVERGGVQAGDAIAGAVRDAATDLIPMRSWVRRLSGAERHDQLVRAAVEAGAIRRGYLKGVGLQLNCLPPAAPRPIAIEGEQELRPERRPRRWNPFRR